MWVRLLQLQESEPDPVYKGRTGLLGDLVFINRSVRRLG